MMALSTFSYTAGVLGVALLFAHNCWCEQETISLISADRTDHTEAKTLPVASGRTLGHFLGSGGDGGLWSWVLQGVTNLLGEDELEPESIRPTNNGQLFGPYRPFNNHPVYNRPLYGDLQQLNPYGFYHRYPYRLLGSVHRPFLYQF